METVMLTAGLRGAGGKEFAGYVAMPPKDFTGKLRGCVVVLHEAFGVTPHIKRVCEDFADQGYAVIAPAMLSLATGKPEGKVLGQTKAGLDEARELIGQTDDTELLALIEACVAWGKAQELKVAVCGYCWGGSVAYASAAQLPQIDACVCYYGGKIHELAAQMQPKCATLVHLAKLDRYIPIEAAVTALATYNQAAHVEVYEADHGFNRDDGVTFDMGAAMVARRLTLDVFDKNLS